MIPIINSPKIEEFTFYFHPTLSYHQTKRFQQYLTGVITGRKATIRSIVSSLINPADQSSPPVPDLLLLGRRGIEPGGTGTPQSMEETQWHKNGVVAIDDTFLPRLAGRFLELKSSGFTINSYFYGQSPAISYYVDQDKDYSLRLQAVL